MSADLDSRLENSIAYFEQQHDPQTTDDLQVALNELRRLRGLVIRLGGNPGESSDPSAQMAAGSSLTPEEPT